MAFFLDEDDGGRVLEAALSFVDRFELDSSPRANSTAPRALSVLPSTPLDANADELTRRAVGNAKKRILRKAGVYSDPNRARNERRREVESLRQQVEKLQVELRILQSRRVPNGAPRAVDSFISRSSALQIPSMWQQVAAQQYRRRNEVESENVRLKRIAARQKKVAESLGAMLKKRANQLTSDCSYFMDTIPRQQLVGMTTFQEDVGDFQGLFRQLEAARREIDVVFAANGLANMVVTPSDVHIREGDDGEYLEAFSNKFLAFRLPSVTEALWSHFKGLDKHAGNGKLYEKAAKDLDESCTIMEHYTMEMHSNTSRADIRVKQVIRRYVEDDRDIVIWVSRVSPVEIKHKMLRGLTYHLRGHAMAKRSSASTPERDLSQLQFCSLISFNHEAETFHNLDNVRAIMNFLIVNTAQKMKVHQDCIENALAEQALRREIAG